MDNMESAGLFWGVVIKPDKRCEQVVGEEFRVTKACVDPSTLEESKVTSVILETDDEEFILCNLNAPNGLDKSLDLTFAAGEKICFRSEGGATVHLTGHLTAPDMEMPFDEESDSDGEEEEVPQLVKKRKLEMNGSGDNAAKKLKKEEVQKANSMKMALAKGKADEDSDEDDESDDEDMEDDLDVLEEEEDSEEEESAEEEESPKKVESKKEKKSPAKNGQAKVATPAKSAAQAQETPKSKKKDKKNNKNGETAAKTPVQEKKTPVQEKKTPGKEGGKTPGKRTLKGGIVCEDLRVGNGPEAKAGKRVGMYYDGKLAKNGKKFDSCLSGKPLKFALGRGEVIKGWDVGVEGMKVGGKRRLTIPANMAYGASGAPPDIPPNATLTFEVECKTVN